MTVRWLPTVGRARGRGAASRILAGLGLLLCLSGPGRTQDAVIGSLSAGAGAVGTVTAAPDAEGAGPSALFSGPDGTLYLLDQINGRILKIDPKTGQPDPAPILLPPELVPQDLIATSRGLYVWDGKAHALDTGAAAGPEPAVARAVGDGPEADEALGLFAQMGSQATASAETALAGAARSAQPVDLSGLVRQRLVSAAYGPVTVDIVPRRTGKPPAITEAAFELRADSAPLSALRFTIRVAGKLGATEVLDVNAEGAFVFCEVIRPGQKAGTPASGTAHVIHFDRRGRITGIYDLPISPDQFPSRRFVTITPEGRVLYLHSDAAGVRILNLTERRLPADGRVGPPPKAPPPVIADDHAPQVITAVRPGTRQSAIQTGLAFEGLLWTVTPANHGDAEPVCDGQPERTRRPAYLTGRIGQTVRGVPYCWGCFGSLGRFQRAVDSGTLAGNWCTQAAPRRDTVGVDCSAFVSQCWGLARHYTTADIPSITEVLADPWDLQPGDALNKPGSHVMLFVRFTADRKVEVLEAATTPCNGRVCRNVYPLAVLLARGYQAVRYKGFTQ